MSNLDRTALLVLVEVMEEDLRRLRAKFWPRRHPVAIGYTSTGVNHLRMMLDGCVEYPEIRIPRQVQECRNWFTAIRHSTSFPVACLGDDITND